MYGEYAHANVSRVLSNFFKVLTKDISLKLPTGFIQTGMYDRKVRDRLFNQSMAAIETGVANQLHGFRLVKNVIPVDGSLSLAFFPSYTGIYVCLFYGWITEDIVRLACVPGSCSSGDKFAPASIEFAYNQVSEDFIYLLVSTLMTRKASLLESIEKAWSSGCQKDVRQLMGKKIFKSMMEDILKEEDLEYALRMEDRKAYLDVKLPFHRKLTFEFEYHNFIKQTGKIIPLIRQFREQFSDEDALKVCISGYSSQKWIRSR